MVGMAVYQGRSTYHTMSARTSKAEEEPQKLITRISLVTHT